MDNDVRNRVAMNLFYWRSNKRKMTIKELGKITGVSANTIRLIENELVSAKIDTLETLATALRIDVSKLLMKVK